MRFLRAHGAALLARQLARHAGTWPGSGFSGAGSGSARHLAWRPGTGAATRNAGCDPHAVQPLPPRATRLRPSMHWRQPTSMHASLALLVCPGGAASAAGAARAAREHRGLQGVRARAEHRAARAAEGARGVPRRARPVPPHGAPPSRLGRARPWQCPLLLADVKLTCCPACLLPQVRGFQQLRFEVAQCCAQELSLVVELQLQPSARK